ncbi:MAG: GNAT family N-acetyltransferase [Patescibacteria group bacterium]|nr:GNAT family N-acetyltransferase [Patescibacteria group bacterium]
MNKGLECIVLEGDFGLYCDKIMDFYKLEYGDGFTEATMNNSAFIGLVLKDDIVVAAGRVISDLSRHAQLVDLIVGESYRRNGIGSGLVKQLLGKLKEHKVIYVGVVKDSDFPWLKDFYIRSGFKPLPADSYFEIIN